MRSFRAMTMALTLAGMGVPGAAGQGREQNPPGTQIPQPKPAPDTSTASSAPLRLTLQEALDRARKNSPAFQAALTTAGLAREDRTQARNALLPTVTYNNSALYTQGSGPFGPEVIGAPVIYIANNEVHEYVSQADVHEVMDLAGVANVRKMASAATVARAQAEVASRGLVVTVVQRYYALAAAQQKLETAKRNADEGQRFLEITQELEHGGEVAHADVVKANIQTSDRQRQLQEAQLALLNARLDLAVLVFPNLNDNFELADDLHAPVSLPTVAEVQEQAARNNPDVRAAMAAVDQANYDVLGARAGYFPSLVLDYYYGIDASHFAVNTVAHGHKIGNVGSSILGTLNIPVWNWGTTHSRIKQAQLRRSQAQRELSLAQRKLLASLKSMYAEASTAQDELSGLARSQQLAEESLRLATLRYRNGEATVLEVVDAQSTFATANSAYQDGAVRYRVALANLQTLTGVLTTPGSQP